MQNMRDIRRHINTIKIIQKETKVMKAVYAAKLSKTQAKLQAARPYADKLKEVLARLMAAGADFQHELVEQKSAARIAYVIFTGNRGMAGSYSADVCSFAEKVIEEKGLESQLFIIGKKGRDYFRNRSYADFRQFVTLGEEPDYDEAEGLAQEIIKPFVSGQVREVILIYTPYFTPVRNQPLRDTFLPLSRKAAMEGRSGSQTEYLYEPGTGEVLNCLLLRYLQIYVYKAMLEAKASEHAARLATVGAAADNAEEMIRDLTLSYNRAHQAMITREITEITKP